MLFQTPALLASYLLKLQRMQDAAETALRERAAQAGAPYAADDPAPRAITGAAFGCLVAAQHAWLARRREGSLRRRHRPRHVGCVAARLSIIPPALHGTAPQCCAGTGCGRMKPGPIMVISPPDRLSQQGIVI